MVKLYGAKASVSIPPASRQMMYFPELTSADRTTNAPTAPCSTWDNLQNLPRTCCLRTHRYLQGEFRSGKRQIVWSTALIRPAYPTTSARTSQETGLVNIGWFLWFQPDHAHEVNAAFVGTQDLDDESAQFQQFAPFWHMPEGV